MNKDDIFKYLMGLLLSVIGFFLVQSYNRTNENLTSINKDLVALKLQMSEISAKQMTDARVVELIHLELTKNK